MKRIVITAIGKDQPGIVSAVTEVLYRKKCNIEDSSMSILEGEFAIIMIVSPAGDATAAVLSRDLAPVGKKLGLHVHCKALEIAGVPKDKEPECMPYLVSLLGADQPGLVYRVTRLLADEKLNITDLHTQRLGGGERPAYAMLIEISAPKDCNVDALRKKLALLAGQLKSEITLKPVDTVDL